MKAAFVVLILMSLFEPEVGSAQTIGLSTLEPLFGHELFIVTTDSLVELLSDRDRVFLSTEIKTSPNGRFVAVGTSGTEFIMNKGVPYLNRQLLIFSDEGELVHAIADVQEYAWSPDGKDLVCVMGKDVEGMGFISWRIEVFRTRDWSIRLTIETQRDQDITWAHFDSNIYTTNYEDIFRINAVTGRREKIRAAGIYFSPSGQYYFSANYEGDTFAVYETKTNQEVTPYELKKRKNVINFHTWMTDRDMLIAGDIVHEKSVIDVSRSAVIKTINGLIVGCSTVPGEILVRSSGKQLNRVEVFR